MVIRVIRRIEIIIVTCIAVCGCSCVSGSMTIQAVERCMCARESETGLIVIEGGRCPCGCGVTGVAVMTEIIGDMIGIGNRVEILIVTGITICGRPCIS